MPIKLLLLVLAMALFGTDSYAQAGKSVKVANDAQLIEAMDNPSIGTIELAPGYYAYLDVHADNGTKVIKYQGNNRSSSGCTYYILGSNYCYNPTVTSYPPIGPPLVGYSYGEAKAGVDNSTCVTPPTGCCPDDGTGRWDVTQKPAGASVVFFDTTFYFMDFWVSMPGKYKFRYTWDDQLNPLLSEFAQVETEYNFFGPALIELSATDVCGTYTTFDFTLVTGYDPQNVGVIEWFLDDYPYGDPVPFAGPTTTTVGFPLQVDCCGKYLLTVKYTAYQDCYTEVTEEIFFDCEPIADAGEDAFICYDNCYYLNGNTGMDMYTCSGYTFADNYAYTFLQLSGPAALQGLPYSGNQGVSFETEVCIPETLDPCPYGVYEVQLQVTNGLCYDEDNVYLTFYQMPMADAGDDQQICAVDCFTLEAVPFEYCGVEGVNYWSHRWWTLVSQPGECTVTFDELDPETTVCISGCECGYGTYAFQWNELNVKIVNGDTLWSEMQCYASDMVYITVHEDPEPDAGDDAEYCESDIINIQTMEFEFYLAGADDEPCNRDMAYTTFWSVVTKPGDCLVDIEPYTLNPMVTVDASCLNCKYGEYVFSLTQQNGYFDDAGAFYVVCETSDEVSVWIYQQPEIEGIDEDLYLCNTFAFDLTADGMDYDCHASNWYSWSLYSSPAGAGNCDVTLTNGDMETVSVLIENCDGECPYGEWIFKFTEYNGSEEVYCYDEAFVSVFIFEQPVADAGLDYDECVDIANSPYVIAMGGSMDYCYTMTGIWTKSCGPGDVEFADLNDPETNVTFFQPGKYIFIWTVTTGAEDCEDSDTVTIILLEQPTAMGEVDELIADCDSLCIDLGLVGIIPYEYFGTDVGECPNHGGMAYWSFVDGPGVVTFADDSDPETEMCVDTYGCYTVRWNEINKIDDVECYDYYDVYVAFIQTPDPYAGPDTAICDNCYEMMAVSSFADDCLDSESEAYWTFYSYVPPVDGCPTDSFAPEYSPLYQFSDPTDPNAELCVIDDCLGTHYGTYGFIWVNATAFCVGYDTVYITFNKEPDPVPLTGIFDPSNCVDSECPDCEVSCLMPEDTPLEVCAWSCIELAIDWDCTCFGEPIPGYTYEWSFTGPAGSTFQAEPYWYDCDAECWRGSDAVSICFGECCDTARLYLTITSPEGCETTEEWQFVVKHGPCADIDGPAVADVGTVETYCSCELEVPDPCLLYNWTVEHCGIIVGGQGTQCIDVMWTDYNVNNGWGRVTVTVVDTCTGCCNYDEMDVKVYPTGTIGEATLSGYVMYQNNILTPLNGVEVQLWNSGVPVMSTISFNDVEGGGMGYFEFTGINAVTEFGITASYDAPWYGANATDALAVELKVVNQLPGSFLLNDLVEEAMDVNSSNTISATDALWIKQRAIGMVNYFPAGDWVFNPDMASAAGTYDIMTLNAGDANRSNIPNSMKAVPAIDLITDGVMNVISGQEFTLPIRVADAHLFGAMTLNLGFDPTMIQVIDVVAMDGMLSNISNDNISIAWSSVNPMVLSDNSVIVNLKVKTLGELATSDKLFTIGIGSEFADATASVVEPVTLKTLGVTTSPAAADYFLSSNRPNPFSTSTFIEYTMPESGKVKLSVLDMLGQEIAVLVEATQSAGSYTVEFSAAGLATGVYVYKIVVDGETRDFISTQRMVISH